MRDVRESGQERERGGLAGARQFSLMSLREAQRTVVRACGRLVLGHGAHEPLWASHVDEANASDVALDLSCVNDVDARGLGLLANLARRAHQRGATLSVLAASRVVQRLGEMTRLDRALRGAWNERVGVRSCGAARPRPTGVPPAVRHSGGCGCDESSAAAQDRQQPAGA